MTGNEYLSSVIYKWKQPSMLSSDEKWVYDQIATIIRKWYIGFQTKKGRLVYLDIQQSGSKAKGTAIKGKSDIDIFLSFYDPDGYFTLNELYDEIYNALKGYFPHIRKQNVSIGVQFNGYDIDIVPARRVNSSSYMRHNDHYLWSNKKQTRMLTNIQKHIDLVSHSGLINEIVLLKVWREQKHLNFPSIYLEMFVISAFESAPMYDFTLEKRFLNLFRYIRDNIESKRVVDPGNSNNMLSDELSLQEKRIIKNAAQQALNAKSWYEVVS